MSRRKNTARTKAPPIMEQEAVKELLSIMEEHKLSTMSDLVDVLEQVQAMEKQLTAAVAELTVMRKELAAAEAANHPIKNVLRKTVQTMEKHVAALRNQLDTLKGKVTRGCKNAVADFKEKGISALDNTARFFKLRPLLETMRKSLDKSIQFDDAAIAKIEAVSEEYHKAGQHVHNIGKALMGKESNSEVKPVGTLAKTFEMPYRAERSFFCSMKNGVDKALGGIGRLEQSAAQMKLRAEQKPSIKKTMQDLNEQIARNQKNMDTPPKEGRVSHDSR